MCVCVLRSVRVDCTCVRPHQESGLKVNHPASFAVRLNGAQGKMTAKVHSPSGALDECVVTELEKGA